VYDDTIYIINVCSVGINIECIIFLYDIHDGVCERNQTHASIDPYVMSAHKLYDYECY